MSDVRRIQVLMLGWEYPPHISGGLGTACEGLTTALAPLSTDIQFVVPQLYGVENAPHMRLVSPDLPPRPPFVPVPVAQLEALGALPVRSDVAGVPGARAVREVLTTSGEVVRVVEGVETMLVPSLISPYLSPEQFQTWARMFAVHEPYSEVSEIERYAGLDPLGIGADPDAHLDAQLLQRATETQPGQHYGRDLFGEVARFAARAVNWARYQRPDLVHAHDWMTFPAATRVARMHKVPLVVHVHSLEQDRSGAGANPTIAAIEGAGVRSATRVVAVSHYTARMIHQVHGVSSERIDVVHNGVYARPTVTEYQREHPYEGPLVLFLGRITFQKGPDYFVEAAAKVLEKVPNAKFVMAGSGDMLPRMQQRVKELGIEDSFEFPGFVRGADVEYLFSIADAYVMPSVSEPFGISALEAMSYETPVILSRQSGASEVLRHALKVDFWDINRLAAQIVAVLTYPELRRSIIDMAREEVRRVHWEAAAAKVRKVYERALGEN